MDTLLWILIIGIAILVAIKLGRKPPRPRGGAWKDAVGGIDLPTWVAMEENLDDK